MCGQHLLVLLIYLRYYLFMMQSWALMISFFFFCFPSLLFINSTLVVLNGKSSGTIPRWIAEAESGRAAFFCNSMSSVLGASRAIAAMAIDGCEHHGFHPTEPSRQFLNQHCFCMFLWRTLLKMAMESLPIYKLAAY